MKYTPVHISKTKHKFKSLGTYNNSRGDRFIRVPNRFLQPTRLISSTCYIYYNNNITDPFEMYIGAG